MSDFQIGDRISVTSTGTVVRVYPDGRVYGPGLDYRLDNGQPAFLHEESYHMATRLKHPKPSEGAKITGRRLADTWWKRGTMIMEYREVFMLLASGKWLSLEDFEEFTFDDFLGVETPTITVGFLP